MARRGHGGSKRALLRSSAARGLGHMVTGSRVHGRRGCTAFSTTGRPTASARPRAWLAMPARPSVTAHVTFSMPATFTLFRNAEILLLNSTVDRDRNPSRNNLTLPGNSHAADQT